MLIPAIFILLHFRRGVRVQLGLELRVYLGCKRYGYAICKPWLEFTRICYFVSDTDVATCNAAILSPCGLSLSLREIRRTRSTFPERSIIAVYCVGETNYKNETGFMRFLQVWRVFILGCFDTDNRFMIRTGPAMANARLLRRCQVTRKCCGTDSLRSRTL